MRATELEKLVGTEKLKEVERIPVELHFLETREMLEGYLTRCVHRIWSFQYDMDFMKTYLKIIEAGSLNERKISAASRKVENIKNKKGILANKVSEMSIQEINGLFSDCVKYSFKHFFAPGKGDTLIKGMYCADLVSKDDGFRCMSAVEELIAECLAYNSTKFTYIIEPSGKIKFIKPEIREYSRHDIYMDITSSIISASELLSDDKIIDRMKKHSKLICSHRVDNILERALDGRV